jgi:hypothetical protein
MRHHRRVQQAKRHTGSTLREHLLFLLFLLFLHPFLHPFLPTTVLR